VEAMKIAILGPLEVPTHRGRVLIGAAKERALLSLLAVRAGTAVGAGTLIEGLWGDDPPTSARKLIQLYVSNLRRLLPDGWIVTVPDGYRLEVEPDRVDSFAFCSLAAEGHKMVALDPVAAACMLREALSLWRGPAVVELVDHPLGRAEATSLEESRRTCEEDLGDASLAAGEHAGAVADLEAAVAAEPLRERRWAQLMTALYRSGRQADALRAFQRLRTHLGEEIGIEPCAELAALEEAIVLQKPELDWRATSAAGVTFLFSDVEASTELLGRLGGDVYAAALSDHHRLIRAALAVHDGREIRARGDGFLATFSSPNACVAAVIETQRSLARHDWPGGDQVRVRMGVHQGEASETAAGLVGLDVHRAARVAAIAHGNQILLTGSAAALVRDSLPTDAFLRDLGLHRLKDLGWPEQIFQLSAEGLADDFPPLRSLDNPELPNNLPGFLSAFVGREAELAEIRSLIESSRLVTLTGAGGSGKTRLALQVAAELLDASGEGVWFVDLAPIADPEQVPGAVAATLGIREQAGRFALEMLLEILHDEQVLIVLDNCEHVIDACAKLADLVERSCRGVHLVATSREPLGIDGEQVYRVRPLSLPSEDAGTVEDLEGSDAVELFVERARAHDSTFSLEDSIANLVCSICRRLDGIPFAIELAAARLASMSLVHLNERLDQRFLLLTGGTRNALPRQQTLQATVDWSFDLLSGPERAVLRRMSVFVGGFELEAAEAVCSTGAVEVFEVADIVGSLVKKSLVVAERSSGSLRYGLLETIREYAADQLAQSGGEAETRQTRSAHADFYLQLSETAAPELTGPRQGLWLKRLDLEWDNLQATLAYLFAESDRTEAVLRLGVALRRFFFTRGHLDPIANLRAALERPGPVPEALRARALEVTSYLVVAMPGPEDRIELDVAWDLGERALEMARDLDDQPVVADALVDLLWVAYLQGDSNRATLLGEEAVEAARNVGDVWRIGWALLNAAFAAPTPEDERALRFEALACLRQAGDTYYVCQQLRSLAFQEAADGRLDAARALYEEAIAAAEAIGASWVLTTYWSSLGFVRLRQGELEEAALLCRKSLIACRRQGRRSGEAALAIFVLACRATSAGDYCRAAQLTGAHDVIEADVIEPGGNRVHYWKPDYQQERHENWARLRQKLGEDEFERAYGIGRGLNFNEAVDLAIGRDRPA
jgi:predicted ATPase/DNA-binding SARP family transcriptional activator